MQALGILTMQSASIKSSTSTYRQQRSHCRQMAANSRRSLDRMLALPIADLQPHGRTRIWRNKLQDMNGSCLLALRTRSFSTGSGRQRVKSGRHPSGTSESTRRPFLAFVRMQRTQKMVCRLHLFVKRSKKMNTAWRCIFLSFRRCSKMLAAMETSNSCHSWLVRSPRPSTIATLNFSFRFSSMRRPYLSSRVTFATGVPTSNSRTASPTNRSFTSRSSDLIVKVWSSLNRKTLRISLAT